jgi:hypothetical protein
MTRLDELNQQGQSVWYDNIRRALLESGELAALIDAGVTGVTSNPTIFEKAIAGSTDYDGALHSLVDEGFEVPEIYERLALEDIARTADLLRPIYDRTDGEDGYVSIEVSPMLAYDTEGTDSVGSTAIACRAGPSERHDQGARHSRRRAGDPSPDRGGHQRKCNADLLVGQI